MQDTLCLLVSLESPQACRKQQSLHQQIAVLFIVYAKSLLLLMPTCAICKDCYFVCTGALLSNSIVACPSCLHDNANVRAYTEPVAYVHSPGTARGSDGA
jgi:hypothetical protein